MTVAAAQHAELVALCNANDALVGQLQMTWAQGRVLPTHIAVMKSYLSIQSAWENLAYAQQVQTFTDRHLLIRELLCWSVGPTRTQPV